MAGPIELLQRLDKQVSGADESPEDPTIEEIAENAVGGSYLWYLGDGGYSRIRIAWRESEVELSLTDSSLSRAKLRWEKSKALRDTIERKLAHEINALMSS